MVEILSQDNKKIKYCTNLTRKSFRQKEGKFILEGFKAISEALVTRTELDFLLVRDDVYDLKILDGDSVFIKLLEEEQVYKVKDRIFNSISQTETSQGILAVARKPVNTVEAFLSSNSKGANYLVVDLVQDPGNLGTLIRTAEGAGYAGIIVLKGSADVYSPKIVRSTAGAILRSNILFVDNYKQLLDILKKLDKTLVVTDLDGSVSCYDIDISKDIALVLGNEGNGVSRELKEMADVKVFIPMASTLESLNVAVAGGILMYEAVRNRIEEF